MQKIGAISKSPNRYQQLSIIAFAICVSIRYGIIDYPLQRYENLNNNPTYIYTFDICQSNNAVRTSSDFSEDKDA